MRSKDNLLYWGMESQLTPYIKNELSTSMKVKDWYQQLITDATPENTKKTYARYMQQFDSFCQSIGEQSLPASPLTLLSFIKHLSEQGRKSSTVQIAVSSVSKYHKARGLETPAKDQAVREALRAYKKVSIDKGVKKAPAIKAEAWEGVCERIAKDNTYKSIRDRAIISIGFLGALRISEIASLQWGDIQMTDEGMTVTIRKSKTDQEGEGMIKTYNYRSHSATCPVRLIQKLYERKIGEHVFTSIKKGDKPQTKAISTRGISNLVKKYFGEEFSGHSMRAGFVTAARAKGADYASIMKQTGHKTLSVVTGYCREADHRKNNAVNLF